MPVATTRSTRDAPVPGRKPVSDSTRSDGLAAPGSVLDKLGQGPCVFDGAHRLALFNRRYAEVYGIAPDDLRIGMSLPEVIDLRFAVGTGPDMTPEAYATWRDRIAAESRVSDTNMRLRDGRVIAVHHEPRPDRGWVSTHDDITERVNAEARLSESEARLRDCPTSAPVGQIEGLHERRMAGSS